MAYIVLADIKQEIDRRELIQTVVVGRALDCHVTIHDALLSRRHCLLEKIGEEWVVSDLGSKNGTYVNDELIQKRPLLDGDIVRIGKTRLHFRAGAFEPCRGGAAPARTSRPVDPHEAMATTILGFRYFGDESTPSDPQVLETFPRPRPRPPDPRSYSQVQGMLLEMSAEEMEDAVDFPRTPRNVPPAPMIDGQQTILKIGDVTTFRPQGGREMIQQIRRYVLRISLACAIGTTIAALWMVSWHF